MWSMSDVVNVFFYTQCGEYPMWLISGVVNFLFYTRCGECLTMVKIFVTLARIAEN